MRFAIVLFLLVCGCTRKAADAGLDSFTFVGVPVSIRPEIRQTTDGKVQSMVIKIIEMKGGRYDQPEMFYDFDEGTAPPLKIGQKYIFVAGWGNHGMYYSKVTELKEPIQSAADQRP